MPIIEDIVQHGKRKTVQRYVFADDESAALWRKRIVVTTTELKDIAINTWADARPAFTRKGGDLMAHLATGEIFNLNNDMDQIRAKYPEMKDFQDVFDHMERTFKVEFIPMVYQIEVKRVIKWTICGEEREATKTDKVMLYPGQYRIIDEDELAADRGPRAPALSPSWPRMPATKSQPQA